MLIRDKVAVMKALPSCYACDQPNISLEHAPPQSFFPKTRDLAGAYIFRQPPLVQVPSCEIHNSGKSKEDVYALYHLAGNAYVNQCGLLQRERLDRIIAHDKQREGRFTALILREFGQDPDGVMRWHLNGPRMKGFLANCARALYFWETFEKLPQRMRVASVSGDRSDPAKEPWRLGIEAGLDKSFRDSAILGSNPECFNYSILHVADEHLIVVRMVFYGELRHWVISSPRVLANEDTHGD